MNLVSHTYNTRLAEGMVDFIYIKHVTYQIMWTLTCFFFTSSWFGSFLLCLKGKAKPSMSSFFSGLSINTDQSEDSSEEVGFSGLKGQKITITGGK